MAVTQATQLADFTSGIGTAGAILEVDNVNNKIGIGTTNPQALLQVGQTIKMDGVSGVITATSFVGNVTGVATGLTGTPDITVGNIVAAGATFSGVVTYEDVTNVDSLGIVTARTGLEVTANGLVINAGVSTFAADLSMADKIVHTGDTNTAIRFPSADTFTVETSGTERLRVGSTGTVGVAGLSTATSFGAFNHLSAPFGGGTVSYTVTVATKTANHRYNGSGSSNGYLIDGVEAPFLTLTPGRTYRFVHDNTGSHPLKFYLEADKTTLYSTGVTFDNAYTEIVVSDTTPQVLHYQCTNHAYMGNAVQTNSNISGGLEGTPNIDCGTGSFTGDVDIADKIIHTGDTNTAIRFPSADTFTVETGGSEALRVDSSQRLIIGENSSSGLGAFLQVIGDPGAQIHRGVADASGSSITLSKSRNTTYGSFTKLNDDDVIGSITFRGDDGTDYNSTAALVKAEVDAATGSNDMPGRLVFATTADGANSPTERLRITSDGIVDVTGKLRIDISSTGGAGSGSAEGIFLRNTNETDNNAVSIFGGADDYSAAASAINFINVDHSANAGDISIETRSTSNSYAERFRITSAGQIRIPVNATSTSGKLQLGASQQFSIFQDSSNGYIANNDFIIANSDVSETLARFRNGGAVDLHHNNSKKLETSAAGVTVTGTLNATTDVTINGTSAATTGKAIAMAFIFG